MPGIISKLIRYVTDETYRFQINSSRSLYNDMPDEEYLSRLFRLKMGYDLDLAHPKTFNEKIQWLKLHDRRPEYTMMVDKYAVKDYVARKIGAQYVIPVLGAWKHFDEIDFGKLPEQFVLKTTHDSGGVIICKDRGGLDKKATRKKLEKHLKRNYFYHGREWPYKDVPPRIIAEEYIQTDSETLVVYKCFCFGGVPKLVQVIQNDKLPTESIDYFDVNWSLVDLRQNFPNSPVHLPQPKSLSRMLELCEVLSIDHAFLRVDFYEVDKSPLFSEFTFYSDSGFASFDPPEWDRVLGGWLDISGVHT